MIYEAIYESNGNEIRYNDYGEKLTLCPVTNEWVGESDKTIMYGISEKGIEIVMEENPELVDDYCEEFGYRPLDGTRISFCEWDITHFVEWVVEHHRDCY